MTAKPFRPIEEQLKILRSRGLIIDDEARAGAFLYRNNYYRISGYSLTLRENDRFFEAAFIAEKTPHDKNERLRLS